ncbi:uncharacterized protein [Argopecten irradians]|uniref:uncharacterized protein n=1 Tax=Argopecten irradians TaxID=31199 RepID=UPI00371E1606
MQVAPQRRWTIKTTRIREPEPVHGNGHQIPKTPLIPGLCHLPRLRSQPATHLCLNPLSCRFCINRASFPESPASALSWYPLSCRSCVTRASFTEYSASALSRNQFMGTNIRPPPKKSGGRNVVKLPRDVKRPGDPWPNTTGNDVGAPARAPVPKLDPDLRGRDKHNTLSAGIWSPCLTTYTTYYSNTNGPTTPRRGLAYHNCGSTSWVYSDPVRGDICYWFESSLGSAESGNYKCESKGGKLAYIPNPAAFTYVLGVLDERNPSGTAFVGYTKYDSALNLLEIQSSGQLQTWAEWETSTPIDYGDCVVIDMYSRKWRYHDCYQSSVAVCSPAYVHIPGTSSASSSTTTTVATTTTSMITSPTTSTITSPTTSTITSPTTSTITRTANHEESTTSSLQDCKCQCTNNYTIIINPITNITKELQAKLDNLKQETMVDQEGLSSTLRKRTSASDPRPSSAYVGYLGVTLLSLIFGGILLLDLPRLIMKFEV